MENNYCIKSWLQRPHFYLGHPVYLLVPEMIFIFQYSMDISPFLLVQCWLKHHLFSSIILGRSNVVWRRLIMVFTPIFQLFCVKICLNSAWLTEKMLYSIAADRFLKGRLNRPLLKSEWKKYTYVLSRL